MIVLLGYTIIILNVAIHYEGLLLLSKWLHGFKNHRIQSLFLMGGLTLIHLIEVVNFAVVFLVLNRWFGIGLINPSPSFVDYFNFSLTNYTTLTVSKVMLDSRAQFLSGMEGLNGFMMITWSASFLYRGVSRFLENED